MNIYNILFEGIQEKAEAKVQKILIDEHELELDEAEYHAEKIVSLDETKGKVNSTWAASWSEDSTEFIKLIKFANEYADVMIRYKKDPKIPTESSPEEAARSMRSQSKKAEEVDNLLDMVGEISKKDIIYNSENFAVASPSSYETSKILGNLANKSTCISITSTSKFWDKYSPHVNIFFIINKNLSKRNPKSIYIMAVYGSAHSRALRREVQSGSIEDLAHRAIREYEREEVELTHTEGRKPEPFGFTFEETVESIRDSIGSEGNVKEVFDTNNKRVKVGLALEGLLAYSLDVDEEDFLIELFSM